jgi:hypothetical protein
MVVIAIIAILAACSALSKAKQKATGHRLLQQDTEPHSSSPPSPCATDFRDAAVPNGEGATGLTLDTQGDAAQEDSSTCGSKGARGRSQLVEGNTSFLTSPRYRCWPRTWGRKGFFRCRQAARIVNDAEIVARSLRAKFVRR